MGLAKILKSEKVISDLSVLISGGDNLIMFTYAQCIIQVICLERCCTDSRVVPTTTVTTLLTADTAPMVTTDTRLR